jgi:hypothetical protein
MNHLDNINDRISVVIRSAGERTEFLCKELVLAQGIHADNIAIIRKAPFSLALQASYEAGMAFNRPWTLCLDADVLLLPDSIHRMVYHAEHQGSSIFEVQGLVLDKFFGGPREAGNHVYRTSLLNRALACIPQDPTNSRPEWTTLIAMKSQGFAWRRMNHLVGLHDFEQYYSDIFRKCFIQAHKHKEFAEIFVSYWPQQAIADYDYQVALKGYIEGLEFAGEVLIDARQDIYRERFERLHIDEKPELPPAYFSPSDIDLLVKNWQEPAVYHKYFHYEMAYKKKFAEKKKALGLVKLLPSLLGWSLEFAGGKIRKLVEK